MNQRQDGQRPQPGGSDPRVIKRILLVTDTWKETNGVTKTLARTVAVASERGYDMSLLHPGMFLNVPNPFYWQYRHALPYPGRVRSLLGTLRPDAVHIVTEGPLGLAVRQECRKRGWRFTTSFHTRWDEHGKHIIGLPPAVAWKWVRWFHNSACRVLAPTPSIVTLLRTRGFTQPIVLWQRGIDTQRFCPRPQQHHDVRRPVLMYVGRVSREKNLTAFLDLDVEGTKYIVGDGPLLPSLQRRYQKAIKARRMIFFGEKKDQALARLYTEADVFVFPSKTETFGNVILEALASGVPVAAYPVPGPVDILTDTRVGAMHNDLTLAVRQALATARPEACRALAKRYTWERATDQFLHAVLPIAKADDLRHVSSWQSVAVTQEVVPTLTLS